MFGLVFCSLVFGRFRLFPVIIITVEDDCSWYIRQSNVRWCWQPTLGVFSVRDGQIYITVAVFRPHSNSSLINTNPNHNPDLINTNLNPNPNPITILTITTHWDRKIVWSRSNYLSLWTENVIYDSQLTFVNHIRKCWQLFLVSTTTACHTSYVVQWCCKGTCSCAYFLPRGLLQQCTVQYLLQLVLNGAVRIITRKHVYDHVRICSDHWPPVRQHILFKLCTLVNKCLHRTAPSYMYLVDMWITVSQATGCCLRSTTRCDPVVPCSLLVHFGSCSFASFGPATWNSLLTTVTIHQLSHCSVADWKLNSIAEHMANTT